MISPDLPADLRAALDARLQGVSRTDAADARRRSPQPIARRRLRRDQEGADALAYALARMPATYAAVAASLNALTEIARTSPRTACSTSAPVPAPRAGPRQRRFRRCRLFTLLDANATLSQSRARTGGDSARLAISATCPAMPARTRQGSQPISSSRAMSSASSSEADRAALAKPMWAEDAPHAVRGRARHARGLRADHRAARATDRGRRPCRRALPA